MHTHWKPLTLTLSLLSLSLAACPAPSSAQLKSSSDAAAQKRSAETDPLMKDWMAGDWACYAHWAENANKDEFFAGGRRTSIDYAFKCYSANDSKLVATLQGEADRQGDPEAKEASLQAIRCIKAINAKPTEYLPEVLSRGEADVKACLQKRRETTTAAGNARNARDAEWAALEAKNSAEAWLQFLETHKDDNRAPKAAAHVVDLAKRASADEQTTIEDRLEAAYPTALGDLSAERRLLRIGPKGARIRDLKKMQDAKIAQNIIVARVKASNAPYKTFDGDEMVALKQMGMSDDVIAAMIDVTTKLEERKRADEQTQAIRTELAALKKMIEEKKAASSDGKTSGVVVQTKEGPMDVLASCAKRLGAVKLCEQIPFPGSSICQSTAESSFPCPTN